METSYRFAKAKQAMRIQTGKKNRMPECNSMFLPIEMVAILSINVHNAIVIILLTLRQTVVKNNKFVILNVEKRTSHTWEQQQASEVQKGDMQTVRLTAAVPLLQFSLSQ